MPGKGGNDRKFSRHLLRGARGAEIHTWEKKSGWDGVKGKVEGAGYLSRARQTLYGASPFFCQIPSSRIATQEWGFNLENLLNH